jgi:hypothetical protein
MMTRVFFVLAFMLSAVIGCVSPVVAAPGQGVSQDTIAARERFFGAENVDAVSGQVRADRVIFSWVTNASLAVSIRGRIVLLDTYINRPELRRRVARRTCAGRPSAYRSWLLLLRRPSSSAMDTAITPTMLPILRSSWIFRSTPVRRPAM